MLLYGKNQVQQLHTWDYYLNQHSNKKKKYTKTPFYFFLF